METGALLGICPECQRGRHNDCRDDAFRAAVYSSGERVPPRKCVCAFNGHRPEPLEDWWDEQW